VRVAVVDRLVGVADLAHADLLVHPGVPHQRVARVPSALVQLDGGHARLRRQPLEPLGHVVRVPRSPVGLTEDQVVVLPGWPGLPPCLELRGAMLAQQRGCLGIEEHQPVADLALGRGFSARNRSS